MKTDERRSGALRKAVTGQSLSNFPAIIQGFLSKGIPLHEIKPRENVFTFQAWRALNRTVRRGEHGVKVCTFVPTTRRERNEKGETVHVEGKMPWMTTVFHVSQTDPIK